MRIWKKIVTTALVLMAVSLPITAAAFSIDVGLRKDNENNYDGISADDSTLGVLGDLTEGTGLQNFEGDPIDPAAQDAGLSGVLGILTQIIDILKWIMGAIAVIFLVYTAGKLITAGEEVDDEYTKAKKSFFYIGIGLFSVFAIDVFINNVFVLSDGNFLGSVEEAKQAARIGSQEIRGIYNLFEIFLGIVAVFMMIYNGFRLVANAGDDDMIEKAKKNIIWAIVGIVLIGISEVFVKDIIFVDQGQRFDLNRAKELLVQITNFASGFIATIAIVMFIYAGYLYIISSVEEDNTEKAKKIVFSAVIGILIAGGAFAIVNTFVQFETEDAPAVLERAVEENLN